ncbi:hypothetical protein QNH98_16005 [Myroides sp. mNGS23_01]|nr:hypothetical protein [Myroides sp. mNGS23_01]WHT38496.1 hypothetical protein QNH98_16005 [Myroides sp. mNGS23_01]
MKKIVAILVGSIALTSCSSDDNKSSSNDPIFSQPYTELANLDELQTGKYQYVGNKIGDRKVGLISEAAKCKSSDHLLVHRTGTVLDSITYNNYRPEVIDNKEECLNIFKYPRLIQKYELVSSGYLNALVEDGYLQAIIDDEGNVVRREYRRKEHFKGELEIGFQAGYLRVEDRLSDYKRLKGEKVYLYFKKM